MIIYYILDDTLRRILVSKIDVRDIADNLLKDCGDKPAGKNWVNNFINVYISYKRDRPVYIIARGLPTRTLRLYGPSLRLFSQ